MRILAMVAIGTLNGALLRGWMRFVSTEHEFSWGGTSIIIGVFAILGLMAGFVGFARRKAWTRGLVAVRAIGSVLALGCFQAAGLAMFPTIVPAALGVARSDWWKPLRVGLIGFGVVAAVAVVFRMEELTLLHRFIALVIYLGLCVVEVALLSRILAPSLPRGSISSRPAVQRAALVGFPLLAVFALVIATIGIPTD